MLTATDRLPWTLAIDEWTRSMRAANYSEGTIRVRRGQIRLLARALAPLSPWDVDGDALVDFAAEQAWDTETRRSWRSGVRSFYRWAMGSGRTNNDPSRELASVKPRPPMPRPVPTPTVRDALDHAEPRVRLMLRLGAECGLRRAEIAQVHSRDVQPDLEGWSLYVHGKGRRERVVPVADDLARTIRDAKGFVFPGRVEGHLSANWVGKLLARSLADDWTGHKLRHRAAAVWYEVDHDLRTVQALLGHASLATTEHYVPASMTRARVLVKAARL